MNLLSTKQWMTIDIITKICMLDRIEHIFQMIKKNLTSDDI